MTEPNDIPEFVAARREEWLAELSEFLRIPSVSTDREHDGDVRAAADWLAVRLTNAGATEVEVWDTAGHPVVYGAWRGAVGAPTVLVYGHYDVQPADPAEEWTSPPFEPIVRGNKIVGRGTADDKGQLYVHIKSLQAWLETRGTCPVNIVYLIEGEEEVGSPNVDTGGARTPRAAPLRRHHGLGYDDVRPRPPHPLQWTARARLSTNRPPRPES